MRLLVINPNTSASVTEKIAAVARSAAAPGTELEFVTAPYGVPYIATRAEAIIGGRVVLEILAERAAEFDAAIVAAFGDPGLGAARELFSLPVVGLAEAAMLLACPLGRKFSIVSFSSRLEPWYRECVEWQGLSGRLASIRMLDATVADVGRIQAENEDLLVALANAAVEEDGAEVVILAGAPLAGLASRVTERVPVPLIESVSASVKLAEALVALRPRKPLTGSYRQSAAKPATGLPDALTRLIETGQASTIR
ncbi:Asp/Glu/hydantoin racemase [Azoarcus sp. L1K30]|uniref:aspartate/glutamate racemase family protein n=1 Tax=Azoarcus sp. L1K30 TaxID=2820277 RepID=UPI001B835EE0|nr:aspartate/glutamate racemase family protein [Azoarcus sp. L1K30]MBR0566839.1 Asp/Glu/hydantoin racemase [Azoarcus sp. L1K30]